MQVYACRRCPKAFEETLRPQLNPVAVVLRPKGMQTQNYNLPSIPNPKDANAICMHVWLHGASKKTVLPDVCPKRLKKRS